MRDPWKHLMKNVEMSATHGATGARVLSNPKKAGRIRAEYRKNDLRVGNQSTKRHECTITISNLKEMWDIQNGMCYWLGVNMSLEDLFEPHSPFAVSVDRLDSEKGYLMGNIVLTIRFANKGRGSYDNSNFKKRLNDLLEKRSKDDIIIPNIVSDKCGTLESFL